MWDWNQGHNFLRKLQSEPHRNKEITLSQFSYLIIYNILGAVGFLSAFFFVEKIYGSVKVDWYSFTKTMGHCVMQCDVIPGTNFFPGVFKIISENVNHGPRCFHQK